jgi:hypothetical protein
MAEEEGRKYPATDPLRVIRAIMRVYEVLDTEYGDLDPPARAWVVGHIQWASHLEFDRSPYVRAAIEKVRAEEPGSENIQ